jgi:DNA-binding NarL/FixJ family response regulator
MERMRKHASFTELLLTRSSSLGHLGMLAGLHHERLDGSGYRGVRASFLPVAARVLAAADTYHTKLEPRPHRGALTPEAAAEELQRQVQQGRLDGEAASAVIAATRAFTPQQRHTWPQGLTDREVDVLRLAVQGLSNRDIAAILVVSPKTVSHHIQHIYDKIGVSTRVGATLFAMQHHLLAEHLSV